jgi:hypothetical protein
LVGTCKVFINVLLFVQSQDWCLIFQFLVLKTTCFFHSMLVKYLNPVLIIFSAHDDILKPKCAFLLLKPPFFIPNQLTLEAIGSNAASSVCGAAPEGARLALGAEAAGATCGRRAASHGGELLGD